MGPSSCKNSLHYFSLPDILGIALHCRFWTSKPEGCKRGGSCRYLHDPTRGFTGEKMENRRTLSTIYENDTGEVDDESCDQCDVALHGNRNMYAHRVASHVDNGGIGKEKVTGGVIPLIIT